MKKDETGDYNKPRWRTIGEVISKQPKNNLFLRRNKSRIFFITSKIIVNNYFIYRFQSNDYRAVPLFLNIFAPQTALDVYN